MDDLKAKVVQIEGSLQEASRLINLYDRSARADIGKDVSSMKNAVTQCQARMEQVVSETGGFMRRIEYLPASEVDLKPQIAWLSQCMAMILVDLQGAEEKARIAISTTMNYECLINDVSQDVAVRQRELSDVQQKGETIANTAEQQLRNSEQLVEEKESSVRDKNNEIGSKTSEMARLRSSLSEQQNILKRQEASLATARAEAKEKKTGSAIGFGAAILGVGLAPFTMGLSLAATAVGAGVGVGLAISYSELKDQISSTNLSISSLKRQISNDESTVTRLTRERDQLQASISQLRMHIQSQRSAQSNHRSQISKVSSIQSNVLQLQGSAGSVTSNVKDMASQLLPLKQALSQCAAALDEENTELHVKTSVVDGLMIRRLRQNRQLKREKDAVTKVTDALNDALAKLPVCFRGQT